MHFDRFHHCILWFFVWPRVKIPVTWVGRTIDDVTTISPEGAEQYAHNFVKQYRRTLADWNIGAAPDDPLRKKAFDASTEGEVLGIINMTWQLPEKKLIVI